MAEYTKYFTSCKGVFQGGGCKAIAYVGAYRRAYERGVFFSELAGTSAGSIIAALIAAGATPDYLEKLVNDLDFNRFIKDYKKSGFWEQLIKWRIFPKKYSSYKKYISWTSLKEDFGFFDSSEIERFMETELRKLTGRSDNVTFNDLIPNLHIVCANLETHSVHIWSKTKTPMESVAKAVRCSCSIPVFFQPVDKKYIDGGVLSNLPNFIFTEEPHYNQILCFKLDSSENPTKINSLTKYLSSLIDTVVEGVNDIQQKLIPGSFEVPIKVKDINSTDFSSITKEKIDSLLGTGADAMNLFLDKESVFAHSIRHSKIETKEQMRSLVSYISLERHKDIYVSCEDTYWCWVLFLSVVRWVNHKSRITVITSTTINEKYKEEELARRRMLNAMGCKVVSIDKITLNGYFFSNNDKWEGVVFSEDSNAGFRAKHYHGLIDGELIKSWIIKLKKQVDESPSKSLPISIKKISQDVIIERLRKDAIYEQADFNFETIKIEDISFMNPYIRALKYKQIEVLFNLYTDKMLNPFSPAALVFGNKKTSLIGPPVVELKNGKYYLIEGNTRCVYAYRHGIKELQMLVVRNVEAPIPCDTKTEYSVSKILISDREITRKQRYKDFDYTLFRHIEECLRPYNTYLI